MHNYITPGTKEVSVRKVEGVRPDGKYYVSETGTNVQDILTYDYILDIKKKDEANNEYRAKQDVKNVAETKRLEQESVKHNDIDGFKSNAGKLELGKALKVLNSLRRFNGQPLTIKEFIRNRIKSGSYVETDSKGNRVLMNKDDTFMDIKGTTKIGMDYAEYLYSKTGRGKQAPDSGSLKGFLESKNPLAQEYAYNQLTKSGKFLGREWDLVIDYINEAMNNRLGRVEGEGNSRKLIVAKRKEPITVAELGNIGMDYAEYLYNLTDRGKQAARLKENKDATVPHVDPAKSTGEYMYGLSLRPFGIATQPAGQTGYIPPEEVPRDIKDKFDARTYRHGIVIYPQKLSERDADRFDLIDFSVTPSDEKWLAFVELIKDLKEYDYTITQFIDEFIKPNGESVSENPLYKNTKPSVTIIMDYLSKNGYPGNMNGLISLFTKTGKQTQEMSIDDFTQQVKDAYYKQFPRGWIKGGLEKSIGQYVALTFGIQPKEKWFNGYESNDPAHQSIVIHQVKDSKFLPKIVADNGSTGSTMLIKPKTPNLAYSRIKLGYRKKTGTPEQVLDHIKKYFVQMRKIVDLNRDKLAHDID